MKRSTIIGACAILCWSILSTHAMAAAPMPGDTPQIQFAAADGSTVDLAKLKGKMVVVDFWATWCGPCMAEAPHMVQLNQTYASKGLQMIGISLDQNKDQMLAVAKEKGLAWPQYFDGQGWQNKLAQQFSVEGIPFTMLISPEGKVLWTGPPDGLDAPLQQAFKEHPPVLVDPKTLAQAQTILSQVETKLNASDAAGAAKLFNTVPAAAKSDKDAAARMETVHKQLSDLADTKLADATTLLDDKDYPKAMAALRVLTAFPADLPATTKAQAKLRDLSKDPQVKRTLANTEKNAKADAALADARKLQTQKKETEAYLQFKQLATAPAWPTRAPPRRPPRRSRPMKRMPASCSAITIPSPTRVARAC